MANNPLAYTGTIESSADRIGLARFDATDFTVQDDGTVCLAGGGALQTMSGDAAVAKIPIAGNFQIAGTASQISATAVDGVVTLACVSPLVVGTFSTSDAAAGIDISGNDIVAAGTDTDISITFSAKGTGNLVVAVGDIIAVRSDAAGEVTMQCTNSDNSNSASDAFVEVAVGGTSSGNPGVRFQISGGQAYSMGIDNADSDILKICGDNDIGTDPLLSIAEAGDVAVEKGNLIINVAGKQLQVQGGSVTDSIGAATLVAGTVTVANTNIAADDKIFISRQSINGSSALGMLTYSISAATSFTITAVQTATPASAETNDISIVEYFIVRQL